MAIRLKAGVITQMAPADIERDPKQVRQTFDEAELRSLGESMRIKQQYPIKVRQEGKRTIIVDGERRWRGARLVKLAKVDVLLDESTDLIDLAASQLTSNVQRAELSALDIAEFLEGLQKREKLSTNALLAALDKRGIKEVGPAKLERIMRLNELPDWAKEYMRKGVFGEGHGNALLVGIKWPAVMKHAHESVKRDLQWRGEVTVGELTKDVEHGFRMNGIDLNEKHSTPDRIRAFPIEQCRKGCEHYKKIGGVEYCMSKKEFQKKQDAALLLKSQKEAEKAEREKKSAAKGGRDEGPELDPTKVEPRKVKVSGDNVVILKGMTFDRHRPLLDANFNVDTCKGCPHKRLASRDGKPTDAEDHCFYPPCFNEKTRLGQRDNSRRGKLREYIEAWLRPIVVREAPKRLNEAQQRGVMLWLATGSVDSLLSWHGQREEPAARATLGFLQKHKLNDLPALMAFATSTFDHTHVAQLVAQSVQVMTQEQLFWFAQYINLELNDPVMPYRIDEGYLRMKRKAELQELAKLAQLDVDTVASYGVDELRTLLLEHKAREAIAVPAEIEMLYREPPKARDTLSLSEDDLMDDENDSGPACIGCGCNYIDPCEPSCAWAVQEDRASYMHNDGPLAAVCSAEECAPHMERWRRGDREFTPEALTRIEQRKQALKMGADPQAMQLEGMGDLEAAVKTPTKKKRA